MKYLLHLPVAGPQATSECLGALARKGEELGFDVLAASERLILPRNVRSRYPYGVSGGFPGGEASQRTLEMLTVLAFLAGQTSRIRLLTSVLVLPYRNPLLAAKMLATLDVLSGGRLTVGCGVGWMREEFQALEVPTPFEDRGAVSNEYIEGLKELWTSPDPSFQGRFLNFSDLDFTPKPVQTPHPPFWIGGESPAAMRRVARLADGWMPIAGNPRYPLENFQQLESAIQRLRAMTEAEGRDPNRVQIRFGGAWSDTATKTDGGQRQPLSGNASQVAEDIHSYQKLGVSHLYVSPLGSNLQESLERMESFMTQVAPLV